MEDAPLLGRDDERQIWNKIVGRFDSPAYVRRAKKVESVYQTILNQCESQRREWLQATRLFLGMMHAQSDSWRNLQDVIVDDDKNILPRLWNTLSPQLRSVVSPTRSKRILRRAAQEFVDAAVRFNSRWTKYIDDIDLTYLNRLRDDYNRYYVLEKECYMRSPLLARKGFQPLAPMKKEELFERFPLLPVPRLS